MKPLTKIVLVTLASTFVIKFSLIYTELEGYKKLCPQPARKLKRASSATKIKKSADAIHVEIDT